MGSIFHLLIIIPNINPQEGLGGKATSVLHYSIKQCTPHILEYVQELKLWWKKKDLTPIITLNTVKTFG